MRLCLPLFALLALALIAPPAWAHALGAECRLTGAIVELEAYYDDDTPARSARVTVADSAKRTVAQGKTDAKGRWQFARPEAGAYVVIVDAGAGHRTEIKLNVPFGAPASEPAAVETTAPLTEGQSREEFTRFPWMKLMLGLAIVATLSVAFLVSRRLARPTSG